MQLTLQIGMIHSAPQASCSRVMFVYTEGRLLVEKAAVWILLHSRHAHRGASCSSMLASQVPVEQAVSTADSKLLVRHFLAAPSS